MIRNLEDPLRLFCPAVLAPSALVFSLAVLIPAHAQNPAPIKPAAAPAAAPAAYETDPKFQKTMAEAKQAIRQRMYSFAVDDYRKANKLAGGACGECLNGMFALQMGLNNYKDAIATAEMMEAVAVTPRDKSIAKVKRGDAMLRKAGEKPKPEQLAEVHAVLQSALADFPHNNAARWSDACTLARMGKDDEAKEEFTTCAKLASATDPMRIRAQHFAENPALSLEKRAPAFEVTALDGKRFNLDAMGGRVVLIDFWATWCGPCNEELPHMQKIAKEFAGQPLVIISVSWDSDEAKWKDFINKHEMTWVQYRDVDHKLSNEFDVQAIPHYFTIDSDGVLTAEMLGSGSDVEGKLKKLIKRAKEAQQMQVAAAKTEAAPAQ